MHIIKKLISFGVATAMISSFITGFSMTKVSASENSVTNLKVNSVEKPLGLDQNPVFSWIINMPDSFNKVQTAYQIKVSSTYSKSQNGNGDIWDSGKVSSDNTVSVAYAGQSLMSKTTYYWSVKSFVGSDEIISEVSSFSTGMLNVSDWQGDWIGKTPGNVSADLKNTNWLWLSNAADNDVEAGTVYLRKKFTLQSGKTIKSVSIAFTADDNADFYINGAKRASCELWTSGILLDATDYVVPGDNIIAVKATNSSKGYAGFTSKVNITYTDNSTQTIITDNSWKISKTEQSGWENLSFNDSSWNMPNKVKNYGSSPWGSSVNLQIDGERSAVMLRKEFSADNSKIISEAKIYICGLGFFDLTVNGKSPDNSVLNPFTTQYDKTVLYRTFDVTSLLNAKDNAIGVELGNSFYNETVGVWRWDVAKWRDSPKMRFNMEIKYSDGTKQTVVSDNTWKMTTSGPTIENSVYYGETYDANREQTGFNLPGFDDSKWTDAKTVVAPSGVLKSQIKAPIKRTASFEPKTITKLQNGSYIIKSPEMVSGWIKLSNINETKGAKITITYGQKLNEDGTLQKWGGSDGRDSGGFPYANLQQDNYICKGTGNEVFEPKFSYKGYVYIQIDGLSGNLTKSDITIYRVSNGVDIISDFNTSDSMINTLHKMMQNSIANNFQGEHCDPLIEKNGWLGDVNVSLPSMMYNYDMTGCLPGYIDVMEDGYNLYGVVPIMVPNADWGNNNYPVWNSLFVYGVRDLVNYFGTSEYYKKQYDIMHKYAAQEINVIKNNGWVWGDNELADWVSPMGGTNPDVQYNENPSEGSSIAATCYVYGVLDTMAQFAGKLGKTSDEAEYHDAMSKIYTAFNQKFYKTDKKIYETNVWNQIGSRTKYRQTSNLLPLAFGLVPSDKINGVVSNLIKDIKEKNYHLDTGCVGTKLILPILCDYGYSHIAYKILKQKTYPSWGFWLEQGTDSLWEMWETTSRSRDHYFLGTYDEWFFSGLAGIDDIIDGYKNFKIKPDVINDLDNVNCNINTVRGKVTSKWEIQPDGSFNLIAEVPVGSQAEIYLPTNRVKDLTVNSVSAESAEGVKLIQTTDGKIVLTVGSGKYNINSTCTDRFNSQIKQAEEIDKENYIPSAWTEFINTIQTAKDALNNIQGSQVEIEAVKSQLKTSVVEIEKNLYTEKINLRTYIDNIKSLLNKSDFVEDNFNKYYVKLNEAEALFLDSDAKPTEYNSMILALENNVKELSSFRVGNIAFKKIVSASSSVESESWGLSKIVDSDRTNQLSGNYLGWSTSSDTNKNHTEWLQIDLGIESTFDTAIIYPSTTESKIQNSCYGFPEDFNIYVSCDASNWTKVLSRTGYQTPSYGPQTFNFNSTTARYIKFEGTKLRPKPTDGNTYRIQLSEFELYNTHISNGITKINGKEYYYQDGFPLKNTLKNIDSSIYYFDSKGEMQKNRLISIDNKNYYFKPDGKAVQSDIYTAYGKIHYADSDGKMVLNKWVNIGGREYYFGADGTRVEINDFINVEGKNYYLDNNFAKRKGPSFIYKNGCWFYIDKNGIKTEKAAKVTVNGKDYFLNAKGVRLNGTTWVDFAGKRYRIENGVKQYGNRFIIVNNKKYRLAADGSLLKGSKWITISGKTYYLKDSEIIVNKLYNVNKKTYSFDKNGIKRIGLKLIKYGKAKYFLAKNTGVVIKEKWVKYKKKWYYSTKSGKICISKKIKIRNVTFRFNKNGICINKTAV